ncbi:MAG: arginine--tRNA ligase [Candidatus Berkelbacteria bacterium]|nr:MAG: arginine--tRNA ligase [Candidatus Berkelbacteria bacterium]QQG51479.1 MAG: arginine--tRNA ligase [Candidatus Berkelbacteria bacterium]
MIIGQVHQVVRRAFVKAFNQEPPKFDIEFSRHRMFGDFSSNVAMVSATDLQSSPMQVAQRIVQELESTEIFKAVSVTTPGFINVTVTDEYLTEVVKEVIRRPEAFGRSDLGKEIRVLLEFVSANPTGPLTLANGRGAFVGESIAKVLELYGCTVMREYYVNDRGVQVDALGHSILNPKDPEKQYSGIYVEELRKRIKDGNDRAAGEKAAMIIMEEMIKPTLRGLGIDFHQFFSEASLYQTGVFKKTMELLKLHGFTYEAEGATWISTTRFGDDKDRVLTKSDGEDTYFASDIAYHNYKIARGYHRLITVLGADHHTYARQMNMIIEGILRSHYTWAGKVDWVITQIVKLIEKGKEIKMSKRAGTYVPLDELIEQVGPDVARFFFLSRSVDSHLDFDLDLARSASSQNPVFYIQYAYARISSIFRQFSKTEEFEVPEKIIITDPLERQLLLRIVRFPDLVEDIAGDLEVHKLTHYATALATDLHAFYERLRVQGEEPLIAQSRLAILKATSLTIKKTLDLIGISAPSRMVRDESPKS